jgi:Family of unknown function (DUF6498)
MASFRLVPTEPAPGAAPPPVRWSAALGIVAANGLTLAMAVAFEWPLGSLLWPYWLQSLVIGFFARQRILALQRFSTEGFRINDRAVLPTPETRRSTANFFALHYGFFHVVYIVFLLALALPRAADLPWFTVALVGFVLSHQRSFRENVAQDLAGTPNIGTLMFLPYARIVPMHLVIVAGALWVARAAPLAVAAFVVVKTIADLAMHAVEHRVLAGPRR